MVKEFRFWIGVIAIGLVVLFTLQNIATVEVSFLMWTIQVPSNYKGDPKFYLKFCTAATSSDVQFEMDLAKVVDGESFNTIDESLGAQAKTGSATDWYQVTMGAFVPALSLSPNQTLIVHIHRDASDAPDTYTGSAYVALLVFDYEAV